LFLNLGISSRIQQEVLAVAALCAESVWVRAFPSFVCVAFAQMLLL
jgi:hypothetical protein